MVAADLDPAGLRLLGLRDVDLDCPVAVVGPDAVLARAVRHPDGAAERAEPALEADEAVLDPLLLAVALRRDGQRVVVELDRNVLLGDPPGRSNT